MHRPMNIKINLNICFTK